MQKLQVDGLTIIPDGGIAMKMALIRKMDYAKSEIPGMDLMPLAG